MQADTLEEGSAYGRYPRSITPRCWAWQPNAAESLTVGEVTLDPARKSALPPRAFGQWAVPVPGYFFLHQLVQKRGECAYANHPQRAVRARAVYCTPQE